MSHYYDFDEVRHMTASELLRELGIRTTGKRVTFTVNGGDTWVAWMTRGRGRQHGKRYIHISAETMVTVVDDDGEKVGEIGETLHFRGRVTDRIGDLRPV